MGLYCLQSQNDDKHLFICLFKHECNLTVTLFSVYSYRSVAEKDCATIHSNFCPDDASMYLANFVPPQNFEFVK